VRIYKNTAANCKESGNFTENVVLKKQVVVLVVMTDTEDQLVDVEQICTRHFQLLSIQRQWLAYFANSIVQITVPQEPNKNHTVRVTLNIHISMQAHVSQCGVRRQHTAHNHHHHHHHHHRVACPVLDAAVPMSVLQD